MSSVEGAKHKVCCVGGLGSSAMGTATGPCSISGSNAKEKYSPQDILLQTRCSIHWAKEAEPKESRSSRPRFPGTVEFGLQAVWCWHLHLAPVFSPSVHRSNWPLFSEKEQWLPSAAIPAGSGPQQRDLARLKIHGHPTLRSQQSEPLYGHFCLSE